MLLISTELFWPGTRSWKKNCKEYILFFLKRHNFTSKMKLFYTKMFNYFRKKQKTRKPRVVIDLDSLSDSSLDGKKKNKRKGKDSDPDIVISDDSDFDTTPKKKRRKRKRDTSDSESETSVGIKV